MNFFERLAKYLKIFFAFVNITLLFEQVKNMFFIQDITFCINIRYSKKLAYSAKKFQVRDIKKF